MVTTQRPESGILPPVVPYKSFSSKNLITVAEPPTVHSASTASATSPASSSCIVAEKPQSPKRRQTGTGTGERSSHRKSILQRSRTINYVPENCNSPPDHQDNLIHLTNGRSHLNSSAGFHHDQVGTLKWIWVWLYFLHLMYNLMKWISFCTMAHFPSLKHTVWPSMMHSWRPIEFKHMYVYVIYVPKYVS